MIDTRCRLFRLLSVSIIALTLAPGIASSADSALRQALSKAVSSDDPDAASAVVARTVVLLGEGRFDDIADIDDDALDHLLPILDPADGAELIVDLAESAGRTGNPARQDRIAAIGDRFIDERLTDAHDRLSMAINLGYGYLGAERGTEAFARLTAARDEAVAMDAGDDLARLCAIASDTFIRAGFPDLSYQFYDECDDQELLNQTPTPARSFFWHNYALVLRDQGQFDKAMSRHYRALQEFASQFGDYAPEVRDAYDGMAQTALASGMTGSADSLAEMAIDTARSGGTDDGDDYYRLLNNAAAVKRALLRYGEAEALDRAALEWRKDNLGNESRATMTSWYNHTLDLMGELNWEDALQSLNAMIAAATDPSALPYSPEKLDFFRQYLEARKNDAAGKPFEAPALETVIAADAPYELIYGVENLLAGSAMRKNDFERAYKLIEAFDRWTEDALLAESPARLNARLELAAAEMMTGRPAAESLTALNADMFNWVREQSMSGSYSTAVASRHLADILLYLQAEQAVADDSFAPSFADAVNLWKTFERPADVALARDVAATGNTDLEEALRRYRRDTGRFMEYVRSAPVTETIVAMDGQLRAEQEGLNARLTAAGLPETAFIRDRYDIPEPAGFDVKEGDVVVELIVIDRWETRDLTGDPILKSIYGVVYQNDAPIKAHLVGAYTAGAALAGTPENAVVLEELAGWLSTLEAKRLFVVSDGFLYQSDMTGLRAKADGPRLGEVADVYLLSRRNAYLERDRHAGLEAGNRVTLAGGLFYDEDAEEGDSYLAGSLTEVELIGSLVERHGATVTTFTGNDGTEEAIASVAAKSDVLHLATHGFFVANDERPYSLFNAGIELSEPIYAGDVANPDDNIAYAQEILDWDLLDTKLVVLSACETGLGADTPIDAVRGLPMALARAGASRALITLDVIPDKQTATIMDRFYTYLVEDNKTYADAFLATKRDIWAGRLDGVEPSVAEAFVFYEN